MNILLIGSGGREHALALKISSSKKCSRLFIAPGNAGTATCGENVLLHPLDFSQIAEFALAQKIDMVVVGPEEPLVKGIWDYFQSREALKNILVIGPSQKGAQLEGSKAWAKEFMGRYGIPTARYREFTKEGLEEGRKYLKEHDLPVVLKADGLAAGKGVVICTSRKQALAELEEMLSGKFGQASDKVVVEQFLSGIEFSVFVVTDGKNYKILPEAKDYKRVGEKDKGPNTGGMGAVSPVPFVTSELWEKVEQRIIVPTVNGIKKEKIPYVGFIFFGLIVVNGDPFVIEYNCRMGDPETEVVMFRLKSDLVELLMSAAKGRLKGKKIKISTQAAATVMLVSGGYPGDYEKNKEISGWEAVKGSVVLHAGTRQEGNRVVTSGGRVLAVTSVGKDLKAALRKSNRNAKKMQFDGKYFRRDIGKDVLPDSD